MNILIAIETWPFAAALVILLALGVIEGFGLFLGHSPSEWLQDFLPDAPDGADGVLGWLHWGKVPLLVLLVLFLMGFSMGGYVVQSLANGALGNMLPVWLASMPALLTGLASMHTVGGLIARIVPRDETAAVSENSLIGRAAVVSRGIAKTGYAAEAKVRDIHGKLHYVMVEPDLPGQVFAEGASVVLVSKIARGYSCIANPHPQLLQ
jgi:hypothetical protein